MFDEIRDLFTQLPESKRRGYKPGRFSFNVDGGRCEACEGNGSNQLEMDFLADVWVTCPVCEGQRFNRETLQVRFKGQDHRRRAGDGRAAGARASSRTCRTIRHKLQTLHDVGLDYLKLGQPSPTLSGGEAQRIKLARELVKKSTGKTLYLLDEPTTGLHFADIKLLLKVLHDFVDAGNTVLVVEHNLDVIKTADWVIDLGPEGGEAGGRDRRRRHAGGSRRAIRESHTGRTLAPVLRRSSRGSDAADGEAGRQAKPQARRTAQPVLATRAFAVAGRAAAQPEGRRSSTIPRDQMTVFCGPSG